MSDNFYCNCVEDEEVCVCCMCPICKRDAEEMIKILNQSCDGSVLCECPECANAREEMIRWGHFSECPNTKESGDKCDETKMLAT